jgi:hypothetical protein
MKTFTFKTLLLLVLLFSFNLNKSYSQVEKRFYSSTSLEMIFSFADVSLDSGNATNIMRWAPVLNVQWIYNFDFTKNFGLFTGLDVRNLGFIWKNDVGDKWKHRVYSLGLPIGFKLGNLKSGMFFYAGYQIEWAFNYKEKHFFNDSNKIKNVYWFTDRVNIWQSSVLAGVNFPFGLNLKFKYYFTNLLNSDYEEFNQQGEKVKPYAQFTSDNIFYFSLSFNMFHRDYEYFYSTVTSETVRASRKNAKRNWF